MAQRRRRRSRRRRRNVEEASQGILSGRVLDAKAREEGPGLLLSLGQALSFAGDKTRGGLVGKAGERVTAREFLRELGIEPESEFDLTNPRGLFPSFGDDGGFKFGGIAAGTGVLLTDLLTDPTTLLAGFGAFTKGAKGVQEAARAIRSGQAVRDIGRKVGAGRGAGLSGVSGGNLERAARVGARESRDRIAEQLVASRSAARKSLEGIPKRLRQANLFEGGVPQIQRLVKGRRGINVDLPTGREAITLGVPFTKARARLPIAPLALEQKALSPFVKAAGGAKRGLQRALGRGINEETRTAARFLRSDVRMTADQLSKAIKAEMDTLVGKRSVRAGGSFDDVSDDIQEQFQVDVFNAREGRSVTLTNNERLFADDLSALVDGATEAQIATGARYYDLIEDYAERILTPEARRMLRNKKLANPYRRFMNGRAGISEGSQIRRKGYLRDQFTADVNEFFKKNVPELAGKNFFDLNPAVTVEIAIRDRGLSVIQANLVESLARNFGNMAGRSGDMTLPTFLSLTKLKKFSGVDLGKSVRSRKGTLPKGSEEAIAVLMERAGLDPTMTLPKEIAMEALDMVGVSFNKLSTDGTWKKFLTEIYDPVTSMYRALATTPFPGFHARNFTGNIILNAMAGVRNPVHYGRALVAQIKGNEQWAKRFHMAFDPTEILKLERLGAARLGRTSAIQEELKAAALASGNRLQQAASKVSENAVVRQGAKIGDLIENNARIAHFYAKQAEGIPDLLAVQSVNKHLFNYGKDALAPFERDVANRLFFFYRWNRYALPLVLGQLFDNPARFAALGRLTTQPGVERPAGIPAFIREAAGIPGAVNEETGETSFTTKFGSPFEVLSLVDPTGATGLVGTSTKAAREIAANFVPPLRFLLEIITGEEFFLGTEIEGLDQGSAFGSRVGELVGKIPGLEQVGRDIGEEVPTRKFGITRNRRAPALRIAARNLPTSRATSTITRLLDAAGESINQAQGEPSQTEKRKTIIPEILRSILGVNIAQVDTKRERRNRIQRVLAQAGVAEQLKGNVGNFNVQFATEKGKRDRRTQELIKFRNKLRRRRR